MGNKFGMTGEARSERRLMAGRRIRWSPDRAAKAYAAGWWVNATLADALQRAAAETPDRVVLIDGEHRIDCRRLYSDASRLAGALLARAAPGAVVSFVLPNWHEAATIYLATTLAGMVAHPILPSMRERELAFMLADVDSRIIFIPEALRGHDFAGMLTAVCAKLERPPKVVVLRGGRGEHSAYDALLAEEHEAELPAVEPDAVRMILYTSGTTGTPKGVMHSHNTIHALVRQLDEHWLIEPGDTFIVPSPISHIGGSIYAFEMPLLLGTAAVLMERWEPKAAVALIDGERCTHMAGATPFLKGLVAAAQDKGSRLASLKVFICGGASIPPPLIRAASEQFENAVVTRVYGSTEVPVITVGVIDRSDLSHAADTDGRPGIAEVRLVPHSGAAPGTDGEIFALGPQMLVGYVHEADEAEVFDSEGFYRTGDLGLWVDGKFLVISGRVKDIIIRNGENISPREIEDVLLEHPEIVDVAIVGLPHPVTGERAVAVVVAREAASLNLNDVTTFLAGQGIAAFKRPEQLVVWDALPKNTIGKVLKHEIRATLLASAGKA